MYASQHMRNASSLSTESSEFEFEFHDETPLSPKLLFSPNYSIYTPNHFPNGETVLKASTKQNSAESDYTPNHFPHGGSLVLKASANHQHCTERHYTNEGATPSTNADNFGPNGLISSLPGANCESGDDAAQIKGALNDNQQGLWAKFDQISVDNHTNNDNYEASSSVLRANDDVNEGRRGTTLGSLLKRRDLQQLTPLTNYNDNDQSKKEFFPASAISPCSSHLNYHANHSPNPCKCEDYCPDSTEASTSPPDVKSSKKKSKKWAFNLDFLKKSSSPRVDQALNRRASSDNYADDSLNYDIKPNQHDHFSVAAVAERAGFDNYLQERDDYNGGETAGDAGNQRIDHYRAAAAASEARFNGLINQSISANYRPAGNYPEKEGRLNQYQQVNQSIDHYRGNAAAVIMKYESPRQSTGSVISSVSSSPRHAVNEVIRDSHKKISRIAPMSPAWSSPRSSHASAGDQNVFTRGRPPMSPHALHYQQKKAREDELRRKTFLPYRQSLLGACFFPISAHPHHPQHAVF